jgi:hypothetical protein
MSETYREATDPKHLRHGHTVVGRVVEQLTTCDARATRGVLVRCPGSSDPTPNTALVWIGGVDVTADSSPTGGMPLPPGQAIVLPVTDASRLFIISTEDNQDVAWMLV